MGKYTREDILRLVREEDIQFIRMQFTDIFGQMKNVAITASQIEKALDNQIMMDGSSIEGFVRIEESDQYLWPDLDTFAILPWRPQYGKVARLICDVHNPDGTPFVGDPRGVLKRALARARFSTPRGSPTKGVPSGLWTSQISRATLPYWGRQGRMAKVSRSGQRYWSDSSMRTNPSMELPSIMI